MTTSTGRGSVLVALVIGAIFFMETGAVAHQPLFVTSANATPEAGPLIEDGSISFAVYGTLDGPTDTRGVRTRLRVGDPLIADLLVPALEPEQSLPPAALPTVSIRWPDGSDHPLESDLRIPFDEPFSKTRYVRIAELKSTATQPGIYEMTVTGLAPARFTLATGLTEGVPGSVSNAQVAPEGGVAAWYAKPPIVVTPAPTSSERSTSTVTSTRPTVTTQDRLQPRSGTDSSPTLAILLAASLATLAVVGVVRLKRRKLRS